MERHQDQTPTEVTTVIDGKTYKGFYGVHRRVVAVTYNLRSKTTPIGESSPSTLAGLLLRELVEADKKEH